MPRAPASTGFGFADDPALSLVREPVRGWVDPGVEAMQVPAMSATDDLPDAVAPRAAWLHSDLAAVTGNRPREESSPMPLAYQVALAAVRERERLANELHDGLGQLLAIAQMRVDELASACESDSNRRIVDELKSLLDEASRAAHAATFDLHSPVLDQLGLDAALRGLVDRARPCTSRLSRCAWCVNWWPTHVATPEPAACGSGCAAMPAGCASRWSMTGADSTPRGPTAVRPEASGCPASGPRCGPSAANSTSMPGRAGALARRWR
jgi:hypothetical protein